MIVDNIIYGARRAAHIPEESAGWVLYRHLMKYTTIKKSFVDEATGKSISYSKLLKYSCSLAEALKNSGVTSGDVVAICSENNNYFFIVVLAGLFAGFPITTINPAYTETELAHALNVTRPTFIFCSETYYNKFAQLQAQYEYVKKVLVTTPEITDRRLPNGISLMDFVANNDARHVSITKFEPKTLDSRNHVALIMWSSGTTGLPKGAMITHHNVNARLMTQYDPNIWYQTGSRNVLGLLPFFHAFGLQMILGNLLDGKTIYVLQKFDPVKYLTCIQKCFVDTIVAVPTLLSFLAKHPLVDKYNLSSIKDICYGSSPANHSIIEMVANRLNVRPRQGYGLTEVTMSITAVPHGIEKDNSIGFVYPGVVIYIRDPNTGDRLGPRMAGEICVKGDFVMKGYYRDEAATREAFTEDGFLRTGDVGYYDEDEYLYIVDRMKELIKYKSFQVAPAELESVLITHEKIKQVAVVGVPDEDAGELPCALVVKQPDVHLTEDEVKSFLAGILSVRKQLYGGVIFVDALPVNSLGKVVRKDLRSLLQKLKSE